MIRLLFGRVHRKSTYGRSGGSHVTRRMPESETKLAIELCSKLASGVHHWVVRLKSQRPSRFSAMLAFIHNQRLETQSLESRWLDIWGLHLGEHLLCDYDIEGGSSSS